MIDGYDGWLGLAWVSARRFLDWLAVALCCGAWGNGMVLLG